MLIPSLSLLFHLSWDNFFVLFCKAWKRKWKRRRKSPKRAIKNGSNKVYVNFSSHFYPIHDEMGERSKVNACIEMYRIQDHNFFFRNVYNDLLYVCVCIKVPFHSSVSFFAEIKLYDGINRKKNLPHSTISFKFARRSSLKSS